MRHYFLLSLFSIGLISKIYAWFKFSKRKADYDPHFIALYKENSLLWIFIFTYLCLEQILTLGKYEGFLTD